MRCPNCKKFIINPVEHEFCVFSSKPAPRIRKIIGPVIKPDEYVAPKVQGELNHQMAKPGAKPPPENLPVFLSKRFIGRKQEDEYNPPPLGIRPRFNNK